jgi:hypothetical protein
MVDDDDIRRILKSILGKKRLTKPYLNQVKEVMAMLQPH